MARWRAGYGADVFSEWCSRKEWIQRQFRVRAECMLNGGADSPTFGFAQLAPRQRRVVKLEQQLKRFCSVSTARAVTVAGQQREGYDEGRG
eukprot:1778647-Rhodomonas_salina.1